MTIHNKLKFILICSDEIVKCLVLGFREGLGSWPVFATDVCRVVMVKRLPVHGPVTIEIGSGILDATSINEAWRHVFALINNLLFFFVMLLYKCGAIHIKHR